jgi:hypothetical protein
MGDKSKVGVGSSLMLTPFFVEDAASLLAIRDRLMKVLWRFDVTYLSPRSRKIDVIIHVIIAVINAVINGNKAHIECKSLSKNNSSLNS